MNEYCITAVTYKGLGLLNNSVASSRVFRIVISNRRYYLESWHATSQCDIHQLKIILVKKKRQKEWITTHLYSQ